MKKYIKKIIKFTITVLIIGLTSGCQSSTSSSSSNDTYTLTLDKKVYAVREGESVALDVTFTKNKVDHDQSLLTFTTSNEAIATTDGVSVYGLKSGTCDITITYLTLKATSKISVLKNLISIETSKDDYVLTMDNRLPEAIIGAIITKNGQSASPSEVSYVSNNPNIATVDQTGLISPLSSGSTTITISCYGISKTVNVAVYQQVNKTDVNAFNEDYINLYGRTYLTSGSLHIDNPASGLEVAFWGTSLLANVKVVGGCYVRIFIDGNETGIFKPITTNTNFIIAEGLSMGLHTVKLFKATGDSGGSNIVVNELFADTFYSAPIKPSLKIEVIGDSISAGYGVLGKSGDAYSASNSDATSTYAAVAAKVLDAELSVIAMPGICLTAFYLRPDMNMEMLYSYVSNVKRTPYDFNDTVDVVVINMGTNDEAYISKVNGDYINQLTVDYQNFLQYVRLKRPNAYIVCIYGFMSYTFAIHSCIDDAVANMNDAKIKYYANFTANKTGAAGHPNLESSISNGQILANNIQSFLANS